MNHVTSDKSLELVPSDSLFAGLCAHMYVCNPQLSFERSSFQEFYIRTELY